MGLNTKSISIQNAVCQLSVGSLVCISGHQCGYGAACHPVLLYVQRLDAGTGEARGVIVNINQVDYELQESIKPNITNIRQVS